MIKEEMTSAAIPGTGQTPEGKPAGFGDPIVNPGAAKRWKKINTTGQGGILRRKKPNLMAEETFAGAAVFEVSSHVFHTAKMEKRKHKTWRKYLEEDDCLAEIREYANKNPGKPIVLRNANTGEMTHARYGKRRY